MFWELLGDPEIKEEEDKKQKLVTATKKGSAVLDEYIWDQVKSQYHVLQKVKERSCLLTDSNFIYV